jgi:hypothetical protein
MSCFKGIEELTAELSDLQALINSQSPCDVMGLQSELKTFCTTVSRKIKECKRQRAQEYQIELSERIGEPSVPVQLSVRLEGYKIPGMWTYRNSNAHKRGFCRRWHMVTDKEEIAELDALYLESLANKEANE